MKTILNIIGVKFKLYILLTLLLSSFINAETLPQFDVTTYASQIFWLVLLFALIYILLDRLVIPKIFNIKQMRQNKILNNIEQTIKTKKDIEHIDKNIEHQKQQTVNTIDMLNDEFNEKIKSLLEQQSKELEKYKKQQNDIFTEKMTHYKDQSVSFSDKDLKVISQSIFKKLNIK